MPEHGANLANRYQAILASYIEVGEERQLEAAFTLGRRAFASGMTLLELVGLHRDAVDNLLDDESGLNRSRANATFDFLIEALATFEMTQRGYWEAQERARWDREQSVLLQRNLLPAAVPQMDGIDIAFRYLPGEPGSHAGGDWYDVFEVGEGRIGLVVGDITGHGVSAAAAMGQLRIAVLAYAVAGYEPAGVVGQVDQLMERLATGDIATLVYMVIDPTQRQLSLVNAGHPPPLVIEPTGEARLLKEAHGRLLGVVPPLLQREQRVLRLEPASRVLLYTDGLIEPLERQGEDGVGRLVEIAEGFDGSADELCDHALAELAPRGARDDICIVAATLDADA